MDRTHALRVSGRRTGSLLWQSRPREDGNALQNCTIYGTSLRMPPGMWPSTLDDFEGYWNQKIETLEVTDWARSLCKDLLHPKHLPTWLKPLRPAVRLLTNQWLPERLCKENGLKITNFDRAMYHYIVGYISMAYPHLPRKLRTSLSKYYMKGLKKAVKEVQTTGVWSGANFKVSGSVPFN